MEHGRVVSTSERSYREVKLKIAQGLRTVKGNLT